MYYRIYGELIEKKLLKNHSVQDVIEYLERIHVMRLGEKTQLTEVPKKIKKTPGENRTQTTGETYYEKRLRMQVEEKKRKIGGVC